MSESYKPVRLLPSEKERAAEVLVRAFSDDIAFRYVFPDVEEGTRSYGRLWNALLAYMLTCGEVYTTPKVRGVACWLPPGRTDPSLWGMLRTGFALPRALLGFKPESRRRMGDIMSYNDRVHKSVAGGPHWYLGALGVHPDYQRRGIGGNLLQPVFARADATGVPCFLETQTEANVRFYDRHGFKVMRVGEVPGHGLKMWALLRPPHGPR